MQDRSNGPDRSLPHGRDGSAGDAASQAKRHGQARSGRPPPSCIPSRSDSNGRRRAGAGKSTAYSPAGPRSLWLASIYQFSHFAAQLGEGRVEDGAAGIHDDIPLGPDQRKILAQRLAEAPADSIPHNRFPDPARHRETDSRTGGTRRIPGIPAEGREQAGGEASSLIVNLPELGGFENAAGFWKWPARSSPCLPATGRPWWPGRRAHHSPSTSSGPWRGGGTEPPDHPWISCAPGSRAPSRGGGYWVEKFVSAL
jgi:hypothetical protein